MNIAKRAWNSELFWLMVSILVVCYELYAYIKTRGEIDDGEPKEVVG